MVVEEVGESFYNPFIPSTIEMLQDCGLVEVEEGMFVIKLPHFTIPLIVRKSDGKFHLFFFFSFLISYFLVSSMFIFSYSNFFILLCVWAVTIFFHDSF